MFRFCVCVCVCVLNYVIINFYKNCFFIIIIIFFFHENYFYFFMFRDVPGCSGMFRVPGFIDALKVKDKTKALALENRGSLWEGHLDMNNLCDTIKILADYFGGESRC